MTAKYPGSDNTDDPRRKQALSVERIMEIAHDLRTPLGGIEAMTGIIAQGELSETKRRAVEALLASVTHLREVASAILHDHAGGDPVNQAVTPSAPAPVLLGPLFQNLGVAAQSRAAAQGIGFLMRLAEGVPAAIRVDGTRLRQMVENLLDNAFKVTRTGTVSLSVDRTERQGDRHCLRFAVQDTGPGFTKAEAERLFEPFSRIHDSVPGTGIGLSLVSRFARALGGEVHAEGTPGGGAVIWFTILVEAESSAAITRAETFLVPAPAPARAPTILVVDDNLPSRMVMAVVLEQLGFAVKHAASGSEALALIDQHHFDAVMMDMTMAGMNGADATRAIRALPDSRRTLPVVAVTGRVDEADRQHFRDAGANAFVPKPLSPRAVVRTLREIGVLCTDEDRARSAA